MTIDRVFQTRLITAAMASLLVAACSSAPTGRVASSSSAEPTLASEVDAIVALLDAGNVRAAKKRIAGDLKKDPNNAQLMLLRDSITRNPQELLGPESYRYTVRQGETMTGLAQRFLGNRLKFYQLSRYNGIEQPASLQAGQVLNIPGRPTPPPQQAVERRVQPAPAPIPREKPKAAVAPAAPARPAANSLAARQARSAGLAALNAGQPAQAVTLLTRAANLAPGNAVIAHDLARARRIAATVGAR
jgi:hypothetical protein